MSDDLTIPDDLAQSTARLVNEIEDQLAVAQDDKKQVYADLREELKDLGMAGPNISKHVAAFKAAISELRMTADAKAKSVEKDAQTFRYVEIIKAASRARAPARTREAEAGAAGADIETGEIIEHNSAPDDAPAGSMAEAGEDASASPAPIQPETAAQTGPELQPDGNLPAEIKPVEISAPIPPQGVAAADQPGEGAASSPAPANTNIKKRWTFSDPAHPDCLDADRCGGFSNLGLCAKCKQAAGHVVQVEATA